LLLKNLKQVTVVGLGLLGGSISLAVLRSFARTKVVGYAHRASTREKAKRLCVASKVADDLRESVAEADIVILATPICTFEAIFSDIADALPDGCIVTDVGSTKVLPHRWAGKTLPKRVHYVGSHPIAGSEQAGVEFARDDLLDEAMCVLTTTKMTDRRAVQVLEAFWSELGCFVHVMRPAEHDRVFANVSHLPHLMAVALVNANRSGDLKFAGKGFMDTSRIASGPANIWADVLLTNAANTAKAIDKVVVELRKLQKGIGGANRSQIEKMLEKARDKRAAMVQYKMQRKETKS
jgi:prephenate dehydrogenase